MHLEGQYERARPDAGYAMAALLAAIAIMGVLWAMAMPVWKQSVQREKEAELIFRAGQYARAVALFQRKYANAYPPNVDILLKEKFLRKKYKDPITNGDFRFLSPVELQSMPGMNAVALAGRPGMPGGGANTGPPGSVTTPPAGGLGGRSAIDPATRSGFGPQSSLGPNGQNAGPSGGIAAVVSKSSAQSIKIFKNRRQYNQWIVTVEDVTPRRAVGTPQPNQNQNQGQPNTGGFGSSRPGMGGSSSPSGRP
jgi:type II secretory pathway pseudopilin PulG